MIERTLRSLKGIGVVAIASITVISLPLTNSSVDAAEIRSQSNFILSQLLTDTEREIDMTPEDTVYLQALQEHYERD
jgi:hypothetical protein